jgi:hypothetical protein
MPGEDLHPSDLTHSRTHWLRPPRLKARRAKAAEFRWSLREVQGDLASRRDASGSQ